MLLQLVDGIEPMAATSVYAAGAVVSRDRWGRGSAASPADASRRADAPLQLVLLGAWLDRHPPVRSARIWLRTRTRYMYVVIMAGGSGTRFWPLSRRRRPKQLLRFFGDRTMIAETVARFEGLAKPEEIFIVTNELLADAVREAVPDVPAENVLEEPMGRNTAPCIGMAAMVIRERGGDDAVMAVFPADHFIRDREAFPERGEDRGRRSRRGRDRHARDRADATGGPVTDTFGARDQRSMAWHRSSRSSRSRTGRPRSSTSPTVDTFGTRVCSSAPWAPCSESSRSSFRAFGVSWSRSASSASPQIAADWRRSSKKIEPVSIDYGVMEGAKTVRVVPVSFGWSDVGPLGRATGCCRNGSRRQRSDGRRRRARLQ